MRARPSEERVNPSDRSSDDDGVVNRIGSWLRLCVITGFVLGVLTASCPRSAAQAAREFGLRAESPKFWSVIDKNAKLS